MSIENDDYLQGAYGERFVRVYQLPVKLTDGYCFAGGVPITFLNVDWFYIPASMSAKALTAFISQKRYCEYADRFLVLTTGSDQSFTFVLDLASVSDMEGADDDKSSR